MNEVEPRFSLWSPDGVLAISFDSSLDVGRIRRGGNESPSSPGLKLDSNRVSKLHARLEPDRSGLWVTDLDSRNGTWLNRMQLRGRLLAKDGDSLQFGDVALLLRDTEHLDDDEDLEAYESGDTVVLGNNRNLPRAWFTIRSKTISVPNSNQIESPLVFDAEALEATIDEPIVVWSDAAEIRKVQLVERGEFQYWNIGRDPNMAIRIDSNAVSGLHAKLLRREDRWYIQDQLSKGGTFVNGQRVSRRYLFSQDILRFGTQSAAFILPRLPEKRACRLGSVTKWLILGLTLLFGIGSVYWTYDTFG